MRRLFTRHMNRRPQREAPSPDTLVRRIASINGWLFVVYLAFLYMATGVEAIPVVREFFVRHDPHAQGLLYLPIGMLMGVVWIFVFLKLLCQKALKHQSGGTSPTPVTMPGADENAVTTT